jgi:hypothetical protein
MKSNLIKLHWDIHVCYSLLHEPLELFPFLIYSSRHIPVIFTRAHSRTHMWHIMPALFPTRIIPLFLYSHFLTRFTRSSELHLLQFFFFLFFVLIFSTFIVLLLFLVVSFALLHIACSAFVSLSASLLSPHHLCSSVCF